MLVVAAFDEHGRVLFGQESSCEVVGARLWATTALQHSLRYMPR